MEEQKFKAILAEAGVPEDYRDTLFKKHESNEASTGLKHNSPDLLLFFAKNAVAKGCRAPW